jgi:iron(III) transport system ATP-binding protein
VTAPVVECVETSKHFGGVVAVDRVSFALQHGEILSILGTSGCGKTSVLRLIAGFEAPDDGEIRIEGRVVSAEGALVPPEKRGVGMVFQEYALFPHMTVLQNIAFGLANTPEQEQSTRLAEVLDLVRLTGLEQRYPHELSGGQQQRVALARTLAPRPVTVLLDEPFSNVDATMRGNLRREVDGILRESGATTIFVTHEREEAFAMADRVAVMRDGRFDQIDTPDALYHAPATKSVARMVGTCDFLDGVTSGGRIQTELGSLVREPNGHDIPDGTPVDVLVRLDDFQIAPDPNGTSIVASREFRGDEIILVVRTPSGAELRCRRHHYSTLPPGTSVTLFPTKASPFVAFPRVQPGLTQ